jgi:membrane-associated HD superfamily phosphohydrolase
MPLAPWRIYTISLSAASTVVVPQGHCRHLLQLGLLPCRCSPHGACEHLWLILLLLLLLLLYPGTLPTSASYALNHMVSAIVLLRLLLLLLCVHPGTLPASASAGAASALMFTT